MSSPRHLSIPTCLIEVTLIKPNLSKSIYTFGIISNHFCVFPTVKRAVATKSCIGIVQLEWLLDSVFEKKMLPILRYIVVDVTHRSPLVVMAAYRSYLGGAVIPASDCSGLKGSNMWALLIYLWVEVG